MKYNNPSPAQMLRVCQDYVATVKKRAECAITITDEKTIIHGVDVDEQGRPKDRIYIPNSTGRDFHADNSFVKLVFGPYGSGKTTLCQQHVIKQVAAMPYWYQGRRKARCAFIRNTSGELYSTTLKSWLTWFGDLGDVKRRQKPLLTYEHTFNDGHGVIELEVIFLALDREDDLRKLKSMELTWAYINELSEVPQGALTHLKGRVNHRYPSIAFCPEPYWCGIICDTNPPEVDHWIYKQFDEKPVEGYKIFHQPPGLIKDQDGAWIENPHCDNRENLAKDYYTRQAAGQTEDFIKVFCLGEYGSVGFGKTVFPEYNDDIHSVPHIEAIQGEPLHLGWDFGLTPACVVSQISPRGQLRVLKEYLTERMGIRNFAKGVVIPSLQRDFPYCKIGTSRADPSGVAGNEIMEELSCIGELCSLGIITLPARSNDIEPRLGSVRYFLNMMIDGKPAIIISREGCPNLRKGFVKHYYYNRLKISGEERYHNEPNKNIYSHSQDALQYAVMEFATDQILAQKAPKVHVDMYNPVMRWQ